MPTMRLPGKWHYDVCITECGCKIVAATRNGVMVGDDFYCECHKCIEKVARVNPATQTQQDKLLEEENELR